MKIKMNVEDLTLRGQLSKLKGGYGDNKEWVKLNNKELKQDFLKTLHYYKENECYLNKKEREYLKLLEEIKLLVYGVKE